LSTRILVIFVPGSSPIYERARRAASFSVGSSKTTGFGTIPSMSVTIPGLVPHVTCGRMSEASISTCLSNPDAGSDGRVFQYSTACSNKDPFGANMTGQVSVSSRSGIVNSASPRSL